MPLVAELSLEAGASRQKYKRKITAHYLVATGMGAAHFIIG